MISFNQAELFNTILTKLCHSDTTEKSFCALFDLLNHTKYREIQKSKLPKAVYFNLKGNTVPLTVKRVLPKP